MAKADADTTTELVLRLHLHKAGLRLRSSGVSFEILFGNQTLLSGNAHGEALSMRPRMRRATLMRTPSSSARGARPQQAAVESGAN